MSSKSVVIIGAGVAGLAAGCYAQMNGYESHIFELHDLPGGLCTAWERKGYTFDGCIHYLYGSGTEQPFNYVWEELGAVQGREFVHHDKFMQVVAPDGRAFTLYCDPDRLEQHMLELSPEDAHPIHELADGIRQFAHFDMSLMAEKPRPLMRAEDGLNLGRQMLGYVMPLAKWGGLSAQEFAGRFKDPFLRRAIPLMFGWSSIPMMAGITQLAYMHNRNAGFPIGGSLEFARAIERRYLELGGQIHYKCQVEKVLVENDQAVGVRLYNDEVHRADYVISAADGRGTIFTMLDGQYVDNKIRNLYDGHLTMLSFVLVSLGVDRDLSQTPHWITYLLDDPVTIAGEERLHLDVKHFCYDPTLAPAGRSSMEVALPADYGWWQRIYGHHLYKTEQEQAAEQVIAELEKRYPGLQAQVEVVDVATPISYERYTGNWQGATCGWLLTEESMRLMLTGVSQTLPGLSHFYMAGQWVEPGGGLPMVAMSGRKAIQLICHEDAKPFVTQTPALVLA